MDALIDLCTRTVVRRDDERAVWRLCILSRNRRDTLVMSLHLMHATLLVKALNGGPHLPACQLVDDMLQLWITLPYDVVQRSRTHPCFLKLRKRTPRFDGLMLTTVSHQQHTIIPMEPPDKLVHLTRRGERRLIKDIQSLFSCVGLHSFGEMMLER
jgi:hypothetical protein